MKRYICSIVSILTIFTMLVLSAFLVCYVAPNWWEHEYNKHNSLDYVNREISMEEAVKVTDEMFDRFLWNRESFESIAVPDHDKQVPFFTEREVSHLEDIRDIVHGVLWFSAFAILAIVLGFMKYKKTAARPFRRTAIACLVLFAIVVIVCMIDFDWAFDSFHKLLFDNDNWILNPFEDDLVNLMRIAVLRDTAVAIGAVFVTLVAASAAAVTLCITNRENH